MRTRHYPAGSGQHGLSLIELMISLLLGALLLAGLVAIFQQGKINSIQDEQIARMQENGRYALRHIGRELSMLGFWGGLIDLEQLDVDAVDEGVDCDDGWLKDKQVAVEFTNDADASPYDCIAPEEVLDGTDILAIRRVGDRPTRWFDDATPPNAEGDDLVVGAIYVKANYTQGRMFNAAAGSPDGPDLDNNQLSRIYEYTPKVLYVRPWSVAAGDGVPALVLETLKGKDMQAEPLVEGIEQIQVEWGIDTGDADLVPDYYDDEPTPAELSAAVTARIYVLVRSHDPVTGYVNDKTYHLGNKAAIGPFDDGYFRRVYTSTVQLRNAERFKLQGLD